MIIGLEAMLENNTNSSGIDENPTRTNDTAPVKCVRSDRNL
jgi:hypothetical protein